MSEFSEGDMNGRLWMPNQGMELHSEYGVPEVEELINRWAKHFGGEAEFMEPPTTYGVARIPEIGEMPKAYASIDIDEMVRNTRVALRAVEGFPHDDELVTGAYHERMSLKPPYSKDVTSILQVLMTENIIPPTERVDEIADIMRDWRQNGVYVVANTSTLPGCEMGTIDFFDEHLEGCFDGLLLPRNHDGTGKITKGIAMRDLVVHIHPGENNFAAIHLDDGHHHNEGFRSAFAEIDHHGVATFAPHYPSEYPLDEQTMVLPTPYETFAAADEFLKENAF